MKSSRLPPTLTVAQSAIAGWNQFQDVPALDVVIEALVFDQPQAPTLTKHGRPRPGGGAPVSIRIGRFDGRKYTIVGIIDRDGNWTRVLEAHPTPD